MPVKRLISRAMYHPLIALSTFYLIDLMQNVDYSVAGALLVPIAKFMSRVVSHFFLFKKLRSSLELAEHSRRDAYLASSVDHCELERRMHSIDNHG